MLREEVDLLEVDLAEIVLAYIDHLERAGELDLEAATEFLVLIAALLELKSRLMLPREEEEGLDLEPQEAAEELLARMLEYRRYRGAAGSCASGSRPSTASATARRRCRPSCGASSVELAEAAYDPELLAEAIGGLLRTPAAARPAPRRAARRVSVERAPLAPARPARAAGSFSFDDAVEGGDRLTEAVTLFALLELYKAGEAKWEQEVPFGPITVRSRRA